MRIGEHDTSVTDRYPRTPLSVSVAGSPSIVRRLRTGWPSLAVFVPAPGFADGETRSGSTGDVRRACHYSTVDSLSMPRLLKALWNAVAWRRYFMPFHIFRVPGRGWRFEGMKPRWRPMSMAASRMVNPSKGGARASLKP